jgi:hypothetical protein
MSVPETLTTSQTTRDEIVLTGGIAIDRTSNPSVAQPTTSIGMADQRIATSVKVYKGLGGSGIDQTYFSFSTTAPNDSRVIAFAPNRFWSTGHRPPMLRAVAQMAIQSQHLIAVREQKTMITVANRWPVNRQASGRIALPLSTLWCRVIIH